MANKYYKVATTEDGQVGINIPSFKVMVRGALAEIKGISKTFETIAPTVAEAFNSKRHRQGIEVEFEADGVVIDIYLSIDANQKIVEVATNVQKSVHDMIENMTSMKPKAIYVHVVSIDIE